MQNDNAAQKTSNIYSKTFDRRVEIFLKLKNDDRLIASAKKYYATLPAEFINDWVVTYDPRNASKNLPTLMPFLLFEKQKELVGFLFDCYNGQQNGVIEKSRDVGATYVCCAFTVWMWLFHDGVSIGWGSRKELLVDRVGDPDSIFEKMRIMIKNLPSFFKPSGYIEAKHGTYMKFINPENNSTITGESGDNIGRGGRKTIFFKDESAFYERPSRIEAALGDNTNVQIDVSTINNPNSIFQNKVETGVEWERGKEIAKGETRIFKLRWYDNPNKTQEWYDLREEKAKREGLLVEFRREVDCDISASREGVLIKLEWINAAIDAHKKLNIEPTGERIAGFDVANEGKDKHALAWRHGILLKDCNEWAHGDPGNATRQVIGVCITNDIINLQYDCIGVGAAVKSETNRMIKDNVLPKDLNVIAWNASNSPLRADGNVIRFDKSTPKNKDFYQNLKAQGWWCLRNRFEKTFKMVKNGEEYSLDDIISIDSDLEKLTQIKKELTQPTYTTNSQGKIIVDKTPEGTKSPNIADAIMMCYHPVNIRKMLV